jgi:hypothetical protein
MQMMALMTIPIPLRIMRMTIFNVQGPVPSQLPQRSSTFQFRSGRCAAHKANAVSQRLATIPGVGPVTALTLAIEIDPAAFESGRHLAAWVGLTPKEHSTGGKQRMGGISRAGNERLRVLLVTGAPR